MIQCNMKINAGKNIPPFLKGVTAEAVGGFYRADTPKTLSGDFLSGNCHGHGHT